MVRWKGLFAPKVMASQVKRSPYRVLCEIKQPYLFGAEGNDGSA
jgi:hypothetical protein